MEPLLTLLIPVLLFLISALPLHMAVRFLGGKTNLLKTAIVAAMTGIMVSVIRILFKSWGGLIGFILLIWIYREMFRLRWIKAFFAWILQFVFLILLYAIAFIFLLFVFGLSIVL